MIMILNAKSKSFLMISLAVVLCLIGLFLRAYFYGLNRSLWLDEAMLALNIVNRPFLGLLTPLDFNQGAPIGFLLLQKAMVSLLGNSDYVLRMIPFIAGLASVPIMYSVSKKYVGGSYALISLGLFALSPKLIYYSSELKQYSTDVLTTLVLLLIAQKCLEDKVYPRTLVMLGLLGNLATWVSHPSLFVFAGILASLGLIFAVQKDTYRLSWLIGIGVVWIIELAFVYFNLRYLVSNHNLINYWSGAFAPLPPWSNFGWYYNALFGMLSDPATLPTSAIVVGLLIIGIFSFAFRKWQLMIILLTPFLLTLIASGLEKYPFSGRLLLFLLPLLFLLLAEGVRQVRTSLLRVKRPLAEITCAFLAAYLLYNPTFIVYKNLQFPPMGEHIKPVMAYIKENHLDTDLIYVYYGAGPAFEFYAILYGFDQNDYISSVSARNNPSKYLEDINKLKGHQRVWFVFSHNCSWCIVNEQEFILDYLDQIGVKKDEFFSDGASVYLYDLEQIR